MAYKDFCARVRALASRAGDFPVVFRHEDGKHIAVISDDVTITGSTVSQRVTIRWGSGHMAMASI